MLNKIFISCLLLSIPVSFSAERKTLNGDLQKKYYTSPGEAARLFESLKLQGDSDVMKKRPNLNEIAEFNGGTAKTEEAPYLRKRPCWADERQFEDIQSDVIYPWIKAWKKKDFSSFNHLWDKKIRINKFAVDLANASAQKMGNIDIYSDWNSISGPSSLKEYLNVFSKIEDIEIVTFKYAAPRAYRDESLNMIKAELQVRYDLRGITRKNERRNDRGPLKVTVVKTGRGWKLDQIENWGLETLVTNKPTFEDVTKVSGVDVVPEYQRYEAVRRGGYALAIADVNGDGIPDMYLGSFGPGKLLLGNKSGKFIEAKATGLGNDTFVKSATFADFNNDGLPDLLLTRFVSTSNDNPESFKSDILIYKNLGNGKFEKMNGLIADRSPADTAMPAAVGDFNGDGLLDFYVGFPGSKDFTHLGVIPERKSIRAQGVYINQGNFKFSENNVGDYNKKKFDKITEHQRIYPHSAVAFDFNQDGYTDIVVIDDRGNISPAYQNDGKGGFFQAQQYIGVKTTGFGMGMAVGDIDNNGILDLIFTNVNFNAKYRLDASCRANWNNTVFNEQDHGLKFYYGIKKGQFAEATGTVGLSYAGEGLSGVEFLDYNNDGFQDLLVTNGLWSGTDPEQDISETFVRSNFSDEERTLMEAKDQTQSSIMKVLAGFIGDIHGKKKATSRPSLAGFQRKRLFRNKGDGTFIEVGYLENIDSIADGYIVAKADVFGTGKLDLVLRNGDPGTSAVNFPAIQVFKNNSEENNNSIRLKLVSSTNGSDAIGAVVVLETSKTKQYQQLIANNGAAQSEPILHFGIGKEKVATSVTITWPDKKITTVTNLLPGLHVIKESAPSIALGQ